MTEQKIELKMIRMSEVQSQEIEWLWYPFIPYGKLTIIQGDPGDGKTTMVLNLAAKLSKGEALDENMKVTEPVNVIDCGGWSCGYSKTKIRACRSRLRENYRY